MIERIADGRTDLVFEYVAAGNAASSRMGNGASLIEVCAYFGDVGAVRFLVSRGETLQSLGEDLGLNGAAFHGHWRLCQFLLEHGADADRPLPETGETPLHAALCTANRRAHDLVLEVLLSAGANPNCATRPSVPTGAFMRDCRTRAETPLHRAAAFGAEKTIRLLLDAGASKQARDMHGDSPLSWASWHLRPDPILRLLCFGEFSIHPQRRPMESVLTGRPHTVARGQP